MVMCSNVSSGGAAFTPLPLWTDSTIAARSTGRMENEGAVDISNDLVTTTNCLFEWGGSIALGAYNLSTQWKPLMPAICAGPACVYMHAGATGTAFEYHATLQYIELATAYIE